MKILIIISTSFVPYGGLTTVVMNYYRALDKTGITIDIASTNEAPDILINELNRYGSRYYNLGIRTNVFDYYKKLNKVLKNHYDIIHVNGNSSTMFFELFSAKNQHVPVRIAHVHTTQTQHPIIHNFIYPLFKKYYTNAIAVSKDAGDWLYKNDYTIFNNAIDINKYFYNESIRDYIRKELNISPHSFVLGTVGKLNAPKNHKFLLYVFAELKKMITDCKLLLVGGGELESDLRNLSECLGIQKDVIFTGMVDDSSAYYQAFDAFAFPSIFEGLGLALIEAQASGLRCYISDRIPKEAILTNQVESFRIENNYIEWANNIAHFKEYNRNNNSQNALISIRNHGYDINYEAYKLRDYYIKCMEI